MNQYTNQFKTRKNFSPAVSTAEHVKSQFNNKARSLEVNDQGSTTALRGSSSTDVNVNNISRCLTEEIADGTSLNTADREEENITALRYAVRMPKPRPRRTSGMSLICTSLTSYGIVTCTID